LSHKQQSLIAVENSPPRVTPKTVDDWLVAMAHEQGFVAITSGPLASHMNAKYGCWSSASLSAPDKNPSLIATCKHIYP